MLVEKNLKRKIKKFSYHYHHKCIDMCIVKKHLSKQKGVQYMYYGFKKKCFQNYFKKSLK